MKKYGSRVFGNKRIQMERKQEYADEMAMNAGILYDVPQYFKNALLVRTPQSSSTWVKAVKRPVPGSHRPFSSHNKLGDAAFPHCHA